MHVLHMSISCCKAIAFTDFPASEVSEKYWLRLRERRLAFLYLPWRRTLQFVIRRLVIIEKPLRLSSSIRGYG